MRFRRCFDVLLSYDARIARSAEEVGVTHAVRGKLVAQRGHDMVLPFDLGEGGRAEFSVECGVAHRPVVLLLVTGFVSRSSGARAV